ncbi:Uncharacterised protein [Mycobacteroides abscessus subsp. abscessus]|uniref:hypothetical protein n=1 Tax=Mycobacteroides abscessus TaxID=36809 RepID=UPI00092C39F8|nr:Uncharacterised protein [Mycobacteroides abscessus subsp. abscessus]
MVNDQNAPTGGVGLRRSVYVRSAFDDPQFRVSDLEAVVVLRAHLEEVEVVVEGVQGELPAVDLRART